MVPVFNASLHQYNTFGLHAKAKVFVEARSVKDLIEILEAKEWKSLPRFILGGGSNVLLTGDISALVIHNRIDGIVETAADEEHVRLHVGAGEMWHDFVMYCVSKEYAGVENLSLIPGTVGAAPMQNIGAYGMEVKNVIETVEAIEMETGDLRIFSNQECQFGYRESIFKKELKGKYIITGVNFVLNKIPQYHIEYGDISKTLEEHGVKELSLRAVSNAVISIRRSKLPDPAQIGNAGSFFKNPEISLGDYERIKSKYPEIPGYPTDLGVKVPAGWLIEKSGWKGYREGQVGVHTRQALVLVNYGGGTGDQIRMLSQKIQDSVESKFEIRLTPEVNLV
ncbi:UDP-N-acetylenolpyruvoylglucosamine reductase [Dyadobacter sp. CECT 9275]|uniref:UDP-N-acetylenolpyruvoylglucosamine reductase n=1 Tax=Dyadobacter helix TaxID=2822344 RepID=A0A916ND98_9BACT|nr:UDP-N-acetylmuramate dehydrogenase [Dyadobacter sp. CECT 9275]CAG5009482.1 UDP-N-acetylenolpyruvoylglucosamine reductase [Dyadobacter sp. CECT 9275]